MVGVDLSDNPVPEFDRQEVDHTPEPGLLVGVVMNDFSLSVTDLESSITLDGPRSILDLVAVSENVSPFRLSPTSEGAFEVRTLPELVVGGELGVCSVVTRLGRPIIPTGD